MSINPIALSGFIDKLEETSPKTAGRYKRDLGRKSTCSITRAMLMKLLYSKQNQVTLP